MPLNLNFCSFKQISRSLESELSKSYILLGLIGTPIIQTFNNLSNFFGPLGKYMLVNLVFRPFMIKKWEEIK